MVGGGVYVGRGGDLINCEMKGNEAPEGKDVYYEWPVGIEYLSPEKTGVSVYPNPVKKGNILTVNFSKEIPWDIHYQLIDYAGKTVQKGILAQGQNTINLSLNEGIYLLVFQKENKNIGTKIIVY